MSPQPQPAHSDLYILIRIRQEVNDEWKRPSGVINSILLCVTFHARLFATPCLNIRYNPLKYQRWTNHINVDIASPGTRAHYALNTESQPHHLLYCLTCHRLTPHFTSTQLFFFSLLAIQIFTYLVILVVLTNKCSLKYNSLSEKQVKNSSGLKSNWKNKFLFWTTGWRTKYQ